MPPVWESCVSHFRIQLPFSQQQFSRCMLSFPYAGPPALFLLIVTVSPGNCHSVPSSSVKTICVALVYLYFPHYQVSTLISLYISTHRRVTVPPPPDLRPGKEIKERRVLGSRLFKTSHFSLTRWSLKAEHKTVILQPTS